jgi:uncharacterized membrane protein
MPGRGRGIVRMASRGEDGARRRLVELIGKTADVSDASRSDAHWKALYARARQARVRVRVRVRVTRSDAHWKALYARARQARVESMTLNNIILYLEYLDTWLQDPLTHLICVPGWCVSRCFAITPVSVPVACKGGIFIVVVITLRQGYRVTLTLTPTLTLYPCLRPTGGAARRVWQRAALGAAANQRQGAAANQRQRWPER